MTRRFRPCTESDLRTIIDRDGIVLSMEQMVEQMRRGPSFTFEVDGEPICCAGLVIPWPGMAMCWMCWGKEASRFGYWITGLTRRFLDDARRNSGIHRFEAMALTDSPMNQQWLARLGFTAEKDGTARAYFSDKRSVIRFERIEEG